MPRGKKTQQPQSAPNCDRPESDAPLPNIGTQRQLPKQKPPEPKRRQRFFIKIATSFGVASAILVGVGIVSYRSLSELVEASNQAAYSYKVIENLEKLFSQIKDAETGNRGYVITGQEPYLEPYYSAIQSVDKQVLDLRRLTVADLSQQRRLDLLEPLIAQRLALSKQIVELRKNKGFETARQAVLTGRGRNLMDQIRQLIRDMENAESAVLTQRILAEASARNTIITFSSGIFLNFFILAAVYYFIYREIAERKRAEEQVELLQTLMLAIVESQDFDKALEVVLRTVCESKG